MGLGDFEYKTEWTEAQPVFNAQIALSFKGRVAARAKARLQAGKRLIKQTPALWKAAQWTRKKIFDLRAKRPKL
jgi:CelD/BcsL family acetyltransferase involved in cellulose biosynthesis